MATEAPLPWFGCRQVCCAKITCEKISRHPLLVVGFLDFSCTCRRLHSEQVVIPETHCWEKAVRLDERHPNEHPETRPLPTGATLQTFFEMAVLWCYQQSGRRTCARDEDIRDHRNHFCQVTPSPSQTPMACGPLSPHLSLQLSPGIPTSRGRYQPHLDTSHQSDIIWPCQICQVARISRAKLGIGQVAEILEQQNPRPSRQRPLSLSSRQHPTNCSRTFKYIQILLLTLLYISISPSSLS